MKKLFSIFFAMSLLISSFFAPAKALADGMIMPPPHYPIYESGQTAAIFYQDGREHLVLSIEFYGNSLKNFGCLCSSFSFNDHQTIRHFG